MDIGARPLARWRRSVAVLLALVFVALLPWTTQAAGTYATDTFTRNTTNGWGAADVGGAYALEGAAASFSVNGTTGNMDLPTGGNRAASLGGPSVQDVSVTVRVRADKLAAGNSEYAYAVMRRIGTSNAYRAKVRFAPGGKTYLRASKVVNGTESPLGVEVEVPGLIQSTSTWVWLQAEATGTDPTTIHISAWADGQAQPAAWQVIATDSTAALQSSGGVGLQAYLSSSSTNGPVRMSFDDLTVVDATVEPPPPPPDPNDPVVAAAGDIACAANANLGYPASCAQADTAQIVQSMDPDAVLTLGDNQYESGGLSDYNAMFGSTWGAFKNLIHPAPGNHEYGTSGAAGYFSYFGAAAGQPGKGYYSWDLGAWHIVTINSECGSIDCDTERAWLRDDLNAHTNACVLAYWHEPRWSSGNHGSNTSVAPFWDDLVAANADLVLVGHNHSYERFTPMGVSGSPLPTGVTEMVVGTGGRSHAPFNQPPLNGELVRDATTYGVLKLVLHPTGYDWAFLPVLGQTFTDSGTASCNTTVAPPFPPPPPPPPPTASASDSFTRTVTSGLGTADVGGAYSLSGPAADFSVNGSAGVLNLPSAGANRGANLGAVSMTDTELLFRYNTNKVSAGGEQFIYAVARQAGNNAYRVKVRLPAGGGVYLRASTVLNNTEAPIGTEVRATGLTHTAGQWYWVRVQVSGTSPTTIRARTWQDGQAEPTTWQLSLTNSAAALQAAGNVGLRVYLSSSATNAPTKVSFDDLLAGPPTAP